MNSNMKSITVVKSTLNELEKTVNYAWASIESLKPSKSRFSLKVDLKKAPSREWKASKPSSLLETIKDEKICVPDDLTETPSNLSRHYSTDSYLQDIDKEPLNSGYVDKEPAHIPTPQSTPNPAPALVPS